MSQVVKARSIQKRGAMSVCSKILLQIKAIFIISIIILSLAIGAYVVVLKNKKNK